MLKKIGFIAIGMMLVSLLFAAAINGVIDIPEVTVSTNPPSGWWRLFAKTGGVPYWRSSAGVETRITRQSGSTATNDCAKFDANGNLVSAGAACGAGGGGGGATILLRSDGADNFQGAWGSYAVIPGTTVALPAMTAGQCVSAEWYGQDVGGNTGDMVVQVGGTNMVYGVMTTGAYRVTVCNNAAATNAQQWMYYAPTVKIGTSAVDLSTPQTFNLAFGGGSDCHIRFKQLIVRSIQ